MPNSTDMLAAATQKFSQSGIESAALDARLLMEAATGLSREELLGDPDLTPKQAAEFESHLARRMRHEPIAYILGNKEFWGLNFKVTPATLIPRPDSETIVESVLRIKKDRGSVKNILDLGTGSGCLLLSLLSEFGAAAGLGVDVSEKALEIAKQNAAQLGLANRARFVLGNWAKPINGVAASGVFDVIVCNPPYIGKSEWNGLSADVKFEPETALIGGSDGLDCYREILPQIPALLAENGVAVFEIGHTQAADVAALGNGFRNISVAQDLAKLDRAVIFQP